MGRAMTKALYGSSGNAKDDRAYERHDLVGFVQRRNQPATQDRVHVASIARSGKYVMTTIKPPGTKNADFYYVANFTRTTGFCKSSLHPTRGIWHGMTGARRHFDPCQGPMTRNTCRRAPFGARTESTLVFARAEGKDANPTGFEAGVVFQRPGRDADQADLYRIPFNEGRGGVAGTDRGRLAKRDEQ